jgi:8-oxo-dGTP pyrophosphatase MutT (NUDIX family)
MVGIANALLRPLLLAFAATSGIRDDNGSVTPPLGEPSHSHSHPPSQAAMTTTTTTTTEDADDDAGGPEAIAIGRLRSLGTERRESPRHATLRRASVLVPLFERPVRGDGDGDGDGDDDGIHVLLTRRPNAMKSHGGEVCLPGGKMDDAADLGDDVRTALREAHEEVGIHPSCVEVLARLGSLESRHSLCVTPIVGLVRPPEMAEPGRLNLNPAEVERAFAVPLRYFANANNVVCEERVEWRGEEFTMRTYHYDDDDDDDDAGGTGERFVIWGLTAHIVRLVARMAYGGGDDDDGGGGD